MLRKITLYGHAAMQGVASQAAQARGSATSTTPSSRFVIAPAGQATVHAGRLQWLQVRGR